MYFSLLGNQYPKESPLVALTALSDDFPKESCLRITRRILKEARDNAVNGLPSVFELIDLMLNRQDEIIRVVKERGAPFCDPDAKLFLKEQPAIISDDLDEVDNGSEQKLTSEKQALDMAKIQQKYDLLMCHKCIIK